jgi:hypothetical protein
MDFSSANGEIDPMEDGLLVNLGVEIVDLEENGRIRAYHG